MTKDFTPVDVPSAISFGLEKWYENYDFPAKHWEYIQWEKTFRDFFDKYILSEDGF
jgi:hypothetical protein|tara:strand:- start:51 stop:218 length:168 start_codon:yes stop_codon:yes gene_type:complete